MWSKSTQLHLSSHACCLQGHYFTSFKVPDTYGVYRFVVSYHRAGYTALDVVQRVCPPSVYTHTV